MVLENCTCLSRNGCLVNTVARSTWKPTALLRCLALRLRRCAQGPSRNRRPSLQCQVAGGPRLWALPCHSSACVVSCRASCRHLPRPRLEGTLLALSHAAVRQSCSWLHPSCRQMPRAGTVASTVPGAALQKACSCTGQHCHQEAHLDAQTIDVRWQREDNELLKTRACSPLVAAAVWWQISTTDIYALL